MSKAATACCFSSSRAIPGVVIEAAGRGDQVRRVRSGRRSFSRTCATSSFSSGLCRREGALLGRFLLDLPGCRRFGRDVPVFLGIASYFPSSSSRHGGHDAVPSKYRLISSGDEQVDLIAVESTSAASTSLPSHFAAKPLGEADGSSLLWSAG